MFEYLREPLYIRFNFLEISTVWRRRMNKIALLPSFQLQCSTVVSKLFVSFARVCGPFDLFGFHLWSRGREPGILSSKTTRLSRSLFSPPPAIRFLDCFLKNSLPLGCLLMTSCAPFPRSSCYGLLLVLRIPRASLLLDVKEATTSSLMSALPTELETRTRPRSILRFFEQKINALHLSRPVSWETPMPRVTRPR